MLGRTLRVRRSYDVTVTGVVEDPPPHTHWLDGFAYPFDLGPAVFLLAVGLTLGIALLTVGTQALRAARLDPATTLRDE